MFSQFSIMQRLLIAILTPLILSFLLLTWLLTSQLNTSIPQLIEDNSSKQVEARGAEINRWLEGYKKLVTSMTSSETLLNIVEDYDRGYITNDERIAKTVDWLKVKHAGDLAIENLLFAGLDGQAIIHNGIIADINSRPYYQDLVVQGSTKTLLTNPVISRATNEPVAVIGEVVTNAQGKRIGLIVAAVSMDELSNIANNLEMGDGSYGWVIDGTGLLVAHPSSNSRMKANVTNIDKDGYKGLDELGRRFIRGESGIGDIINPQGQNITMVWHPIPNTPNWTVGVSVPKHIFTATSNQILTSTTILIIGVLIFLSLIIFLMARQQVVPIKRMSQRMQEIAKGEADLTQTIQVERNDELGELADGFNRFLNRIRKLIQALGATSQQLAASADEVEASSIKMDKVILSQQAEIDQIAVAMNQLVGTVEEVAGHAQEASSAAQTSGQETSSGTKQVRHVINSIKHQAQVIDETASEVEKLQEASQQIGEVMDVIRGVAEQTNLLALNAAIEAARAGEAGRGFAVVADEVRTLAARTHESTEQIQATIDELLERIGQAVSAMHASSEGSSQTVINAENAGNALESITLAIGNIESMNMQIAAATQEQSTTVDELNYNLERIVELSSSTSQSSQKVATSGTQLNKLARKLHKLIRKFKV